MNCRKNVKNLGPDEKKALVQAFVDLKNPTKAPSLIALAQARGATSRYDDYVWLHTIIDNGAHRRPGFLAWHRKYVDLLEQDLQTVSNNPKLTLPYWDWADLSGSNPFTNDFLGGEGDGADNRVTTSDFAYVNGKWPLRVPPENASSIDPFLTRKSPFTDESFSNLPTPDEELALVNVTPLDASPWNDGSGTQGFRNRLEGWFGPGVRFHNAGHVYLGVSSTGANVGAMGPDSSPNDPVFFLHHANVDRLWAVWQQKHSDPADLGASYVPASTESSTLNGHRLGDNLALFGAHMGANYTVDSVLNHKAGGYLYETDIPTVTLDTPSVSFGDVPVDMKTHHAIRFSVQTARTVLFRITAGPSGNFSTTSVTTFFARPIAGESDVKGYVFVAYEAPSVAGATEASSVTVEAYMIDVEGYYTPNPGDELSLLTETIDLLATPVPTTKTAVALVLDRSGSMGGPASTASSSVTKAQILKDAVSVFSALMRPEDGIGVVSYDDVVDRLMDITKMGPVSPVAAGSGRAGINTVLAGSGLEPRNLTGIGAGIEEGNAVLADGQAAANALLPADPYDALAMVVMTDGNENQSPTIDDVADSISANTFAVGLGTAGNVSEAALEKITKNNGGDLLVTGDMSGSVQEFFLTKLFVQVLAGVTNQDIILDPGGDLVLGAKHRIGFDVTEADVEVDVIALSRFPALLGFSLETPDGTAVRSADAASAINIHYSEDRRVAFYRLKLPALPANSSGSHAGRWHAVVEVDRQGLKELLHKGTPEVLEFLRSRRRSLRYDVIIKARSNLNMKASVQQSGREPGATLAFSVQLSEYNQPVNRRARVWAELSRPDGSVKTLSFKEEEPGRFAATHVTSAAGVYVARIYASGHTLGGSPFSREQLVSAATHLGGDSFRPTKPGGESECLCHLLTCITHGKVISPELEKRMRGAGIDMDLLRRCIASCCTAGTHGGGAVREPGLVANAGTVAHAPAAAGLDRAEIRELKRIVAELGVDRELKQSTLIATRTAETAVVIDNSVDNNIQPPATMGYYPKRTKKGKGGAAKKGKGGAAKKGR